VTSAGDELLADIGRYGRQLSRGFITTEELVDKLFDKLAEKVEIHMAQQVIAAVPTTTRQAFQNRIAEILRPDYRKPAWKYGGERPVSDEEQRRESAVLTARVKAWAVALQQEFQANNAPNLARIDQSAKLENKQ
jgi:hypothetical protein